ncbi:hypothetical protein D8674_016496 [Pyrus ussuriensis x Pyrus communis]|uniref:Uncharacterized protein n=1 Tax=Pyrus ussuriensis x Pyrus communis TaxID=2448454 RepID=A0A5N5H9Z1_9ROSA|nr:hypothetical protein D8674_016496 [Pyrus ussuriensis x Pyrus communis]
MPQGRMAASGFSFFSLDSKDPAKAYTSNPSFTQQPPKRPLLSSTTCKFLRNKEPHPQESVIHSSRNPDSGMKHTLHCHL